MLEISMAKLFDISYMIIFLVTSDSINFFKTAYMLIYFICYMTDNAFIILLKNYLQH